MGLIEQDFSDMRSVIPDLNNKIMKDFTYTLSLKKFVIVIIKCFHKNNDLQTGFYSKNIKLRLNHNFIRHLFWDMWCL